MSHLADSGRFCKLFFFFSFFEALNSSQNRKEGKARAGLSPVPHGLHQGTDCRLPPVPPAHLVFCVCSVCAFRVFCFVLIEIKKSCGAWLPPPNLSHPFFPRVCFGSTVAPVAPAAPAAFSLYFPDHCRAWLTSPEKEGTRLSTHHPIALTRLNARAKATNKKQWTLCRLFASFLSNPQNGPESERKRHKGKRKHPVQRIQANDKRKLRRKTGTNLN